MSKHWIRHLRPAVRLVAALTAFCIGAGTATSQTEAQLEVMEVAALAAAPRLGSESLTLQADRLADGEFVWLDIPGPGFYEVTSSQPGAIVLLSFPTADGAFDGQTRPEQHSVAVDMAAPPMLGPVLLGTAHPYLLSVSAERDASFTLRKTGDVPASTAPEDADLSPGDHLFVAEDDLEPTLTSVGPALHIRVIPEARAGAEASLGGIDLPMSTGLYPWSTGEAERLRIRVSRAGKTPPPLVLVRIDEARDGFDETEPNDKTAVSWSSGIPFKGTLLPGDTDLISLEVSGSAPVALLAETESLSRDFAMALSRLQEGEPVTVWRRASARGRVESESLLLPPGLYQLRLTRSDSNAAAADYSVSVRPAVHPGAGRETEPNDTIAAAGRLAPDDMIRGAGGDQDLDLFAVRIPPDRLDHLWNIFTVGARRLEIRDNLGKVIEELSPGTRRISLKPFIFDASTHYVGVESTGNYTLKLVDLGPRPPGFEAEPNDKFEEAQRLIFGTPAIGGFHETRDLDAFAFSLDTETAVEIAIDPLDIGVAKAWLYQSGASVGGELSLPQGGKRQAHRTILPAGDWAIRLRSEGDGPWGTYRVTVTKVPAAGVTEPDDSLSAAARLPRNGDVAGSVGGLDANDQILLTLPQGTGHLVATCQGADDAMRWSLWDIRARDGRLDGERVVAGREGLAATPFGPETGGALRLEIEGAGQPADYSCALRVLMDGWPEALPVSFSEPLSSGQSVEIPLAEVDEEIDIPLSLPEGQPALAGCRRSDGSLLDPDAMRLRGAEVFGDWQHEGLRLIMTGEKPLIRLYPERAGALPATVTCALFDAMDLPGPGQAGDPAPFEPIGGGESERGAAVVLRDLIAAEAPEEQPRGTLPVSISMEPPLAFAAFSPTGQRALTLATVTNDGEADMDVEIATAQPGDGWRAEADPALLRLPAGESAPVTLRLTAPPWLNPYDGPVLDLTVSAGSAFRSMVQPIGIGAQEMPLNPGEVWHAPDALRGGLNVLHADLGAALIEIDGEETDERDREVRRTVHDGLAPHIGAPGIGKDVVFRLAARSTLAGTVIQLRSTDNPSGWPAGARFQTSTDGSIWAEAGAMKLDSSHAPQYAVFEEPREAAYLRVLFDTCRKPCDAVRLQEVQAIAVPGTHPPDLPPINIAAPGLGGHVVYTLPNLTSGWNVDLLTAEERSANTRWRPLAAQQSVVIGFNENRAARIEALRWVGHPDDDARLPTGRVLASVEGPAGPWVEIGDLAAPSAGTTMSELRLPQPRWARYLRLDFDMPEREGPAGPDAIEVIEAQGYSVTGLWEDDRPRAAYEAGRATLPSIAPPSAGGTSRDSAVPLLTGQAVASSVQIERNEDWWAVTVPDGPLRTVNLTFDHFPPAVQPRLEGPDGEVLPLEVDIGAGMFRSRPIPAGNYLLQIVEPPRSVVVTWDTSGSVGGYIPHIRAAVQSYAEGLVPGRDALNLLPFGSENMLLEDFADTRDDLIAALRELPRDSSSAAEAAMRVASSALAARPGAHGVIVLTDGQTPEDYDLWPVLLDANPRVVALSVDSDTRQNAAILKDWAALNGGQFRRVTGAADLAEGLDLAAALFRQPKGYRLAASLPVFEEPQGVATLAISADDTADSGPGGAVELILDASGSMLQRMEGRRRIQIAHDALTGLVRTALPESTPFAFRAFGLEKDACLTELRVPLGPLDREVAIAAIRDVPAINLARTAIAESLRAAGRDLAGVEPPRVIVLVTDGEETCDGNPQAEIEALRAAGLDIRVNIVGFAIDDAELARTFESWADAGGGRYFAADGAEALERAVGQALTPRFEITRLHADGRREALGQIALGEGAEVPAGLLLVAPAARAAGAALEVRLSPGEDRTLTYHGASGIAAEPVGKP